MRKSKLGIEKKQRELLRLRKLTPEERLKEQVKLNVRIKELFFAGLSSKGFSRTEIIRLWKEKDKLDMEYLEGELKRRRLSLQKLKKVDE